MPTGKITEKEGFVTETTHEFWHFLKENIISCLILHIF